MRLALEDEPAIVLDEVSDMSSEDFCCPVEDCPKHLTGYKTEKGLKRHIETAHPELIEE